MQLLKEQNRFALPASILAAYLLSACAQKPSYASYEDCILAEVGNSQTQLAVELLRDACERKFPESFLTAEEIEAAKPTQDRAAREAVEVPAKTATSPSAAAAASDADGWEVVE